MDDEALNSRISRISTIWTLLADAHRSSEAGVNAARLALIQRYQGAAYRYLLGAVRDLDKADELFQEFALRVMQGKFQRADRNRGRFRDAQTAGGLDYTARDLTAIRYEDLFEH